MDKVIARSKNQKLMDRLRDLGSLLVAFSGGVDSTFLLAVANQVLGENVLAVTARSVIHPSTETAEAVKFAEERGIQHVVFHSTELSLPEFVTNGPDRCYHCKKCISQRLIEIAESKGISHVAHAANLDDLDDYRPGLRAAREMGILSPLMDVKLGKEEIRFLSKEMGLSTWEKPSMACLASRIPYWDLISEEKLNMVAAAEEFLANKGFSRFRVRHHGHVARIELESADIKKFTAGNLRDDVVETFRSIGFLYITIDLAGYESGSMNRVLGLSDTGKGEQLNDT
jgi:uncharacterized protein